MIRRLLYLVARVALAMLVAIVVMLLPLPSGAPAWLSERHVPIIVFLLVCYIGKLLYDTLFYDHYWP